MDDSPKESVAVSSDAIDLGNHQRWLRAIAMARLRDHEAVDDVLQNVAIAVLAAQRNGQTIQRVGPWLYRVTLRQCLLYRRSQGRYRRLKQRAASAPQTEVVGADPQDPLKWLLAVERRARVREAVQQLPSKEAQILMLKYCEGWSYRQIACHLGVTTSTVESRLHRARCRLRAQLERRGEDPS